MAKERLYFLFDSFVVLTKDEIENLLWYLEDLGFKPTKYGQSSTRPKYEYNSQSKKDVSNLCYEIGYISVKGKDFVLEISAKETYRKPLKQLFEIAVTKKIDPDSMKEIAITMCKMLKAGYAYVSLRSHKIGYTPGRSIENCLFGFSWLNIFGQPYIDMWGEEVLLSAPADETQNKDYIAIRLSESPLVPAQNIIEKNNELKSYFGEKYFFDYDFEHRQTTFKSIPEIAEYERITLDLVNYIAPDFHRYYNYSNNDSTFYALQKGLAKEIIADETKFRIVRDLY
jgi:hypothetical protein